MDILNSNYLSDMKIKFIKLFLFVHVITGGGGVYWGNRGRVLTEKRAAVIVLEFRSINNRTICVRRTVEKMAVDIFRNVRATGETVAQKKAVQPGPVKDEIETKRKRGIVVGTRTHGYHGRMTTVVVHRVVRFRSRFSPFRV